MLLLFLFLLRSHLITTKHFGFSTNVVYGWVITSVYTFWVYTFFFLESSLHSFFNPSTGDLYAHLSITVLIATCLLLLNYLGKAQAALPTPVKKSPGNLGSAVTLLLLYSAYPPLTPLTELSPLTGGTLLAVLLLMAYCLIGKRAVPPSHRYHLIASTLSA